MSVKQRADIPEGFRVGHRTLRSSGCTVVLPPPGNVASYDMRGSSPGSRELASLDLERRATEIHGLLLTGGSAFGLAAADGVARWLEEHGIGYQLPVATIPLVPAAVIFDLAAGSAEERPGPQDGYAACEAAATRVEVGQVGAGTGATVGKWAGREFASAGGFGVATATESPLSVTALAVVNAFGDVVGGSGSVIAGTRAPEKKFVPPAFMEDAPPSNTVIGAILVNARLTKAEVRFLAARASDGVTRSVRPAHTRHDGDVVFAIAAGGALPAPGALDVMGILAADAMAAAVRSAVT